MIFRRFKAHACVQCKLMDSWGLIEIQKFWGTGTRRRLRLMVQFHTFSEVQAPSFFLAIKLPICSDLGPSTCFHGLLALDALCNMRLMRLEDFGHGAPGS